MRRIAADDAVQDLQPVSTRTGQPVTGTQVRKAVIDWLVQSQRLDRMDSSPAPAREVEHARDFAHYGPFAHTVPKWLYGELVAPKFCLPAPIARRDGLGAPRSGRLRLRRAALAHNSGHDPAPSVMKW